MPGEGFTGAKCGATTRRGTSCLQPAMGNGRCRMHGGKSLAGVAHPNFRHGRNSKLSAVLQGTDLERFEDAIEDPAYVEMREQMALLHMYLMDAVERSQEHRPGELWERLERQRKLFLTPGPERNPEQSNKALGETWRIVRQGVDVHRATQEALDIVERQRKLAETERKRISEENQSISVARALAFAGAVFTLVREAVANHVGGTEEERAIIEHIRAGIAERISTHVDGRRTQ